MRVASVLLAGCLGASALGCAATPPEEEEATSQGCEGRGETLSLGMSKQSADGLLTATLLEADPLPPLPGENVWTVELVWSSGEPVLDASCENDFYVVANAYMADHDHNVRVDGLMTSPGVFEFPAFDVMMNGYWENTIVVATDPVDCDTESEPPVDAPDPSDVMFGFCIAG